MESIKHKMDTMVKEKDAAVERAVGFETEGRDIYFKIYSELLSKMTVIHILSAKNKT